MEVRVGLTELVARDSQMPKEVSIFPTTIIWAVQTSYNPRQCDIAVTACRSSNLIVYKCDLLNKICFQHTFLRLVGRDEWERYVFQVTTEVYFLNKVSPDDVSFNIAKTWGQVDAASVIMQARQMHVLLQDRYLGIFTIEIRIDTPALKMDF
jgi:hypothetical protein